MTDFTKQEFTSLVSKLLAGYEIGVFDPAKYPELFGEKTFTDEQMWAILNGFMSTPLDFTQVFLARPEIKPEHIDKIMEIGCSPDIDLIYSMCETLTPSQIEFGLARSAFAVAAYNHPCCTEEQKVRHNLMGGRHD